MLDGQYDETQCRDMLRGMWLNYSEHERMVARTGNGANPDEEMMVSAYMRFYHGSYLDADSYLIEEPRQELLPLS